MESLLSFQAFPSLPKFVHTSQWGPCTHSWKAIALSSITSFSEHCEALWESIVQGIELPVCFWGIMPMWECASQKTTEADRGHLSKTFWSRLRRYIPSTHRHITLHSCSYFDSMLWMFRHRKDNETHRSHADQAQIKPLICGSRAQNRFFLSFFLLCWKARKKSSQWNSAEVIRENFPP